MMSTIILYKGLSAPASQIITLVMGFLVICFGITILQMSKIDPEELGNKLDGRRSTIPLQAACQRTETLDEKNPLGRGRTRYRCVTWIVWHFREYHSREECEENDSVPHTHNYT